MLERAQYVSKIDSKVIEMFLLTLRDAWLARWARGDGYCFWRAISTSLLGSQSLWIHIKLVVMAHAAANIKLLVTTGSYLSAERNLLVDAARALLKDATSESLLTTHLEQMCIVDAWAGEVGAYLFSKGLGLTVKFVVLAFVKVSTTDAYTHTDS